MSHLAADLGVIVTDGLERYDKGGFQDGDVLMKSFIDMDMLKTEPTDEELFTTKFVPVKP